MHRVNKTFESYSNTPGACCAKEVEIVKVIRVCSLGVHVHTLLHINRERGVFIFLFFWRIVLLFYFASTALTGWNDTVVDLVICTGSGS